MTTETALKMAKIFQWAYECDLDIEVRKVGEEMGLHRAFYPEIRFRGSFGDLSKGLSIRGNDYDDLIKAIEHQSKYIAANLSRPELKLI